MSAAGPRRREPEQVVDASAPPDGGRGLESGLAALVVAWTAFAAAGPLTDNSWFTHLATGRIILDDGAVPTTDPYSFTAPAVAWTVQSWLASVLYAGAEQLGGGVGLRLVVVVFFVAGGAVLWRLSSPADSLLPRMALLLLSLTIAAGFWNIRPFMVAVVGIGVVRWWLLRPPAHPWLAVPLLWIWANMHGSYPLAGLLVVAVLVGQRLDGVDTAAAWRLMRWIVAGVVVAAIGPLGPDIWLFPLTALERSDVLREIVEWQAPSFVSVAERAWLLFVIATIAALVRRPAWRDAVPAIVFVALSLLAVRNIAIAAIVVLPTVAAAGEGLGTLRVSSRSSAGTPLAIVGALVAALAIIVALASPVVGFDGYPTRAVALVDTAALRVATSDRTGNLLEVLDGPVGDVFFDDRIDMYPVDVVDDYLVLFHGRRGWQRVLDTHAIDAVIWPGNRPLASLLAGDADWRLVFVDEAVVVACRRSGAACDRAGGTRSG